MKWYKMDKPEVAKSLVTDQQWGLGSVEAKKRLETYGRNKIAEKKKTSLVVRFLMQFHDFMILVLLAAAGIAFYASYLRGEKDFADPLIILFIVILNAVLGLVQESRAEKSLEALKKMSAPTAKVVRNGKTQVVEAELLVPGDLILLEAGDFVPADVRLVSSVNLKAEESALTGESVPVEKDAGFLAAADLPLGDRANMAFSGSSISYGRAAAIVCETGMNTEVGKIAGLILSDATPQTPLQKTLAKTGKQLGVGALAICLIIFLIGILRKLPPFEMFVTSVSLAVAAIPEGLPAIVTIMLAVGVRRMAKQGAVIRKLPAVETLGSASVICSDKTGTLTQNKMKVVEIFDCIGPVEPGQKMEKQIIRLAALCNDSIVNTSSSGVEILGDPTETALVQAALDCCQYQDELKQYPRVGELPFDSLRKRMTTIHKSPQGGYLTITKGAPDVLLLRCREYNEEGRIQKMNPAKREFLRDCNEKMAGKALRVIAVAYKESREKPEGKGEELEQGLIFAGLIGMMDPPREEAKKAVSICKKAGVRPVMVTGDHVITALAIGRKLGIVAKGDKAMTGAELNSINQMELTDRIYDYTVFARVSPEHKVRIVKAFQERGAVVAMTGDGVNDAPALKAADIGCAMGITGTDVAKAAADMVLTDDNFATIVEAVREGRGIYANIRKAVHFLLSSNIGEIITILAAILAGWDTPLLAIHLLWVNLVTDSLPAIALGVDPPEQNIMEKKPVTRTGSLFTGGLGAKIALEGCMVGILALLAFTIGSVSLGGGTITGRTMCFATLSISQLVHAFNMRTEKSLLTIDLFENRQLSAAFLLGLVMQVSVITIPFLSSIFKVTALGAKEWFIVAILSLMPIIVVELEKRSM